MDLIQVFNLEWFISRETWAGGVGRLVKGGKKLPEGPKNELRNTLTSLLGHSVLKNGLFLHQTNFRGWFWYFYIFWDLRRSSMFGGRGWNWLNYLQTSLIKKNPVGQWKLSFFCCFCKINALNPSSSSWTCSWSNQPTWGFERIWTSVTV